MADQPATTAASAANQGTSDAAMLQAAQNAVIALNAIASPTQLTNGAINFASSGDNAVIAATQGKQIKVYSLFFTVSAAATVTIKDGANTSLSGPLNFAAAGANMFLDYRQQPWFIGSNSNALIFNSTGTVQFSGSIYYTVT